MVGLLHLFWGEKGRLLCPRWCRTSTTPLGWAMLTSLSIQQCLTMQGFTQKVPILKTNTPTHHSPHFPLSPRTKPSSIPVSLELSHNLPDSQFQQFQVTRLSESDSPPADQWPPFRGRAHRDPGDYRDHPTTIHLQPLNSLPNRTHL